MNKSKIEQLISDRSFSYSHPYFYNHPYALRCELGIGDDDQYMANAKKRALEIYHLLFPRGADAIFFDYYISDFSDSGQSEKEFYVDSDFSHSDYMNSLINTETEKIRFILECKWNYRHFAVRNLEKEYPEEVRRNRIVCFSDNKDFDYEALIDLQISGNGQDISFVSFENECILSIYDDRGCDIVFTSHDKMKAFYHKLEPYFLAYDAEEMKKRFEGGDFKQSKEKTKEEHKRKEIEINGCIEIPPEMTMDEFYDAFIGFIESKGWYFGGGFQEIIDGHYVLADGTKGKHVLDDLGEATK